MKKSIIAAGASAVALAAMPVVGVFAADVTSQVDTLDITIDATCTMASVSHAPSSGVWTGNTLAKTVTAGALNENIGSTSFNIICNNQTGWNVSATATVLTGKTTTSQNIPLGTPEANVAAWNYVSSTSTEGVTAGVTGNTTSATKVASASDTTGNSGDAFTVTYNVSTDNALSAQIYEGTITYTLGTGTGAA